MEKKDEKIKINDLHWSIRVPIYVFWIRVAFFVGIFLAVLVFMLTEGVLS